MKAPSAPLVNKDAPYHKLKMANQKLINRLKIFLPFFILAVFVFLAPRANAGLFDLTDIFITALNKVLLYTQGIILGILGNFLSWAAYGLNLFLKAQASFFTDVTIVRTSWAVFRDFANMFFILILIVIAFATIFDIQNYNWKGLMAKFIVAALLINFSLTIGLLLINVSTNLSNVMLNQFSDITATLGNGFGLSSLAKDISGDSPLKDRENLIKSDAEKLTLHIIISTTFTIIIVAIATLALISALIFNIVRVPILWALLIVSPLAWISGILPNTRTFNQKWWNWFLGWTFFTPIYLFALMMGIVILKGGPNLQAAAALSGQDLANRFASYFAFGFQELFYYILTIIILVGGLAASLKASFAAGSGATKVFGTISGGINNWAKRQAYIPAMQKAGKEKLAEIRDTGLPGKLGALYGGEREERLKEARVAGILGKKQAMSDTELAEARKEFDKYKSQNLTRDQIDQLNDQANKGKLNKYQMLALRKLRSTNGWIARGPDGQKEIDETVQMLGENTAGAEDYINDLVKNNFQDAFGGPAEMENFVLNTTSAALKRAGLKVMAKRGDLGELQNARLFTMIQDLYTTQSKSDRDSINADLMKNFDKLDESVVNALIASGKMKDDLLLDLMERRVEKAWIPSGTAGKKEIQDVLNIFGGENTQRSRKYMETLIKNDFMNRMGSQADKEAFLRDTSLPNILRNAGLEVMAKNNDLISSDLIKMGLDSLAGQVKEKRDRIYENLKKNIKSLNKTKGAREAFLLDTTQDTDMRKLQAEQMLDEGELDTYNKYFVAEELFGGENETLSRNALSKMAQDNQIIHAETEWRKERAAATGNDRFVQDPAFFGSTTDRGLLKTAFDGRLQKINPQKIADLNRDSWLIPEFEESLQEKVNNLQAADPGVTALPPYRKAEPAIPPGGTDSKGIIYPAGRPAISLRGDPAYPKGRKAIPGAGERFKKDIQRLVIGNADKTAIIKRVVV